MAFVAGLVGCFIGAVVGFLMLAVVAVNKPEYYTDDNAERCVCCGAIIPEGRQVCPNCWAEMEGGGGGV